MDVKPLTGALLSECMRNDWWKVMSECMEGVYTKFCELRKEIMNDQVGVCLSSLRRAKTDTERLAALFIVVQTLRNSHEPEIQKLILDAVGFEFVNRLLRTKDIPESGAFRGLALSVLSSFSSVQQLAGHPKMLDNFAELMMALSDETLEPEARLDAMRCLAAIIPNSNCASVLEEFGEAVVRGAAKLMTTAGEDEKCFRLALSIVTGVANERGEECWGGADGCFDTVAEVVSRRLCECKTVAEKVELCEALADIAESSQAPAEGGLAPWVEECRKQIYDTLRSRLFAVKPAAWLRLSAALVRKLGLERLFSSEITCLQLLVHLTCVELRMCLDGHSIEHVVQFTEITGSCFCILEAALELLVTGDDSMVGREARHKMYSVVTETMGSVVAFVQENIQIDFSPRTEEEHQLIHGVIRLLGAWLAEETEALRGQVYAILPQILEVALTEKSPSLVFLLPGLCHLSVEDEARKIMLEKRVPEALVEFLENTWDGSDDDAVDATAEVLLNIVVLEGTAVTDTKRTCFLRLVRFLFKTVPELDKIRNERLVLLGHLAVLGLLILRHLAPYLKASDTAIYRFLSATVRFLWDAFVVDDARCMMVVASSYLRHWEDLKEMWFLGLQVMGDLLLAVPWVASFIVESGWGQDVIRVFDRVKAANVEPSVKVAFQDLLCRLVASEDVGAVAAAALGDHGALRVCETHKLKELQQALSAAGCVISE